MWSTSVASRVQPTTMQVGCDCRNVARNFCQRVSYPRCAELGRLPLSSRGLCSAHHDSLVSSGHPAFAQTRNVLASECAGAVAVPVVGHLICNLFGLGLGCRCLDCGGVVVVSHHRPSCEVVGGSCGASEATACTPSNRWPRFPCRVLSAGGLMGECPPDRRPESNSQWMMRESNPRPTNSDVRL